VPPSSNASRGSAPNADVNIGQAGATHIASLSQFNNRTYRVK